jgi:16S rRNA pseudouridine516 synthase
VQPAGQLDADTTGLLLTDVGALIHGLTAPRRQVPKVCEVTTRHPVDDAQVARPLAGAVPEVDPMPVRATACEAIGERALRLVITEGLYHQVKLMVAAAGHRVEHLHRSAFRALQLPPDLPLGQWRRHDARTLEAAPGAGGVRAEFSP